MKPFHRGDDAWAETSKEVICCQADGMEREFLVEMGMMGQRSSCQTAWVF